MKRTRRVFLCDADHGEKTERSAQGGQRPSGNSGADDKREVGGRERKEKPDETDRSKGSGADADLSASGERE